jgi:hypothetical protein
MGFFFKDAIDRCHAAPCHSWNVKQSGKPAAIARGRRRETLDIAKIGRFMMKEPLDADLRTIS